MRKQAWAAYWGDDKLIACVDIRCINFNGVLHPKIIM
jgi:hypothetical protein